MNKPLFIAIGVQKPSNMSHLPGVIDAVENLSKWAKNEGYDVLKIDDRQTPVNIQKIRDQLTPLRDGQVDKSLLLNRPRIIVYFCGHGYQVSQDQYWILSPGSQEPKERISAFGFRDTLAKYGPNQIAFISDSCRSSEFFHGYADTVIDSIQAFPTHPQKDMFLSTSAGSPSFVISGKNGEKSYCLFSKILYQALTEKRIETLDLLYLEIGKDVVSSQSLATYLTNKVEEVASEFGISQYPQCDSGFRPYDNIYKEFAKGSTVTGSIQAFQPKDENIKMELIQNRSESVYSENYSKFFTSISSLPDVQLSIHENTIFSNQKIYSLNRDTEIILNSEESQNLFFKGDDEIHLRININIKSGYIKSGLSNVVILQSGNLFSPIPIFKNRFTSVIYSSESEKRFENGVQLLTYSEYLDRFYEKDKYNSFDALDDLSNGRMNSSEIKKFASDLRYLKHNDPMYGIISAYLYNGIGDIESIRRMCYFYQANEQDVPFDIAILCDLPLEVTDDGKFYINVPEVKENLALKTDQDFPYFVWRSTSEVTIQVAGVTPILRAGWNYIRDSKYRIHKQSVELLDHLTNAPISTFVGEEAGKRLQKIFGENLR